MDLIPSNHHPPHPANHEGLRTPDERHTTTSAEMVSIRFGVIKEPPRQGTGMPPGIAKVDWASESDGHGLRSFALGLILLRIACAWLCNLPNPSELENRGS